MRNLTVTPNQLVYICFGSFNRVADICGVARSTPGKWRQVPQKHWAVLIAASRVEGEFTLTMEMLLSGMQVVPAPRSAVAAE